MLHCSLCMEHLYKICNFLEDNSLIKNTYGILIPNNFIKEKKIIIKQLNGFIKANNINFPICVDSLGVFYKIKKEYDILLIDSQNKNIEYFKFKDFRKEAVK